MNGLSGPSGRNRLNANRKQSVVANTDTFLDPNHTHFILVDDGSDNQFGKEIEFRANLENELRKGRTLKYYQHMRMKSYGLSSDQRGGGGGDNMSRANLLDQDEDREIVPVIIIFLDLTQTLNSYLFEIKF